MTEHDYYDSPPSYETEAPNVPYKREAEQSLIGGLLISTDNFADVLAIVEWPDFFEERCQNYFKAIEGLINEQKPVDEITVCDWLETHHHIPDLSYLAEITKNTPSASNIVHYAAAVKSASRERELLTISKYMAEIIHSNVTTPEKEEKIQVLISSFSSGTVEDFRTTSEVLPNLIKDWDIRSKRDGSLLGYSTGLKELDKRLMGLQAPDMIVIAGKSGTGKTTLAMNIVQSVAMDQSIPTLVFTLEMSGEQLVDRLVSAVSGIPFLEVRSGRFLNNPTYSHLITPTLQKIKDANLTIVDNGATSITQIQANARRFFRNHGKGLLVIDYVSLVSGPGRGEERISYISRTLKALAKELNITIIVLTQMNRNVLQRNDKRPIASDLRESAALEHDCDALLMLYEDEASNPGVMEVICRKLRNGPTGTDYLKMNLAVNRFNNLDDGYAKPEQESGNFSY